MDMSRRSRSELNEVRNLNRGRYIQNEAVVAIPRLIIARVVSRFFCFAMFLIIIPHVGPVYNEQGKFLTFKSNNPHSITKQGFKELIDELKAAEILTEDKKSLVLITESDYSKTELAASNYHYAEYLRRIIGTGADVVVANNFWPQESFEDESFDVVFRLGQFGAEFVDRVLKSGGAVVAQGIDVAENVYMDELNYKCVYVKPYDTYTINSIIIVVVKPTSP